MPISKFIEHIRHSPRSEFGAARHPFSALVGFLSGYSEAVNECSGHGALVDVPSQEFAMFMRRAINARYPERKYGAGQNWVSIIVSETPDDEAAFRLFYELWDEYKKQTKPAA